MEGEYQSDETFRVLEIGHPPSEQREASRFVCQSHTSHCLYNIMLIDFIPFLITTMID